MTNGRGRGGEGRIRTSEAATTARAAQRSEGVLLWYDCCGTMQSVMGDYEFWLHLDALVASSDLVIDRPKGSPHPRYPDFPYPLDYGYLQGTRSGDGAGIDVWVGSLPGQRVTAVICSLDLEKRDAELKILVACRPEEVRQALAVHSTGASRALLVQRGEELEG